MGKALILDPALVGKAAFASFAQAGSVVSRFAPDLWKRMDLLAQQCREKFENLTPAQIPALAPARNLYKAAGVDPTRRRPASEALLRRVLQGKGLFRVNSAVDCCNFCSLEFLLPIGLYDSDRIDGDECVVRIGRPGESYEGHGKETVGLEGQIVVADRTGPFGHPSSDSVRTAVTTATRNLLWIIYAPADFPQAELERDIGFSIAEITACCGGTTRRIS